MDRWPTLYKPGLRWIGRVERAVEARNHPDNGAFAAIFNAIQYQFENGADPGTVALLLAALAQFASSCGISPKAIALDDHPQTTLTRLSPSRPPTR